jgi:hypothetical protein
MILTDIAYFNFVPKETKLLILTGKRVLSDKDYKEILKISTKPPDLLKKIIQQLNMKKETTANKKIEIKTNLNKNAINKMLNSANTDKAGLSPIIRNEVLNKVSDLDKLNEMSQNFQNLNNNLNSHINDPELENILNGLENKIPNNPLNPLTANNNLMNLFANKPELKNLNLLPFAGSNDMLKTLNPGLSMNPQINSILKDQRDLAINNNFNNKPASNIPLIALNKNATEINQKPKAKAVNLSSLKEDFDDFEDFEEEEEDKKPLNLNKNSTVNVNSNSTNLNIISSNKTALHQNMNNSNINFNKFKIKFCFLLFLTF